MKIPVFVSRPTTLNEAQTSSYEIILEELDRLGLEARRLGDSDYPSEFPLREVYVLAKHCSGGVILGFEQVFLASGISKRGTGQDSEKSLTSLSFPSPWNQLEAGILFSLGVPLLVFKEETISGGVFDLGVSDVFIHRMPYAKMPPAERAAVAAVFLKWQARVSLLYYQ